MNEDQESQGEQGEFFVMNLYQIDRMVEQDAGAEELMAYVILARGVNHKRDKHLSTWGANGIAQYTGMTYYRAQQAIGWLEAQGYISKKPEYQPPAPAPEDPYQPVGRVSPEQAAAILAERKRKAEEAKQQQIAQQLAMTKASGKRKTKWVLFEGQDSNDIYLANALIDGIGAGKNNPPLMRIYNDIRPKPGFLMGNARLDCLMTLLHLYRYHLMAECGGVDPRSGVYREWIPAEDTQGNTVTPLAGTNCSLYEIEGGVQQVYDKFAAEALFYIADQAERNDRFWEALQLLMGLGFVYEVAQIWSQNPNHADAKIRRKAEPLYTLYVDDSHARQNDPYLQKEIHTFAFKVDGLDKYAEFGPLGHAQSGGNADYSDSNILHSHRFRYIATSKYGGYPIGVYRLRFRPRTRDNGIGIEKERQRVSSWAQSLSGLSR